MALKKYLTLLVTFVLCLFFDTAVLPRWNLFHLVPFCMLALTLAAERVFSLQDAMVIGAAGGLLEDLITESMIGLTPALCLFAAVIFHGVLRKNDIKPVIAFVCFSLLALFVDLMRALVAWLIGMRFGFLDRLLYGAVPRALLTALWGMVFARLFRPALKGQVDVA